MWFCKRKEIENPLPGHIPKLGSLFPALKLKGNIEFCEKCGSIVKKEYMKAIQVQSIFTIIAKVYDVNSPTSEVYYCTRCTPAYDRVVTIWDKEDKEIKIYSKRVPEHYVSVTEEGKEIKNVSRKNKK